MRRVKKLKKDVYVQEGVAMTCRSFNEYVSMMALDEEILRQGSILDVAAGASSFTADAKKRGYQATAVDPLYELSIKEMKAHGSREIETSTEKIERIAHTFQWDYYDNIKQHRENREKSLQVFLDDYALDNQKLHYKKGNLPHLPFSDEEFRLILSSHFLFLYHEQFSYKFHLHAIMELVRILHPTGEIRLYPLVVLNREPYPHLDRLCEDLTSKGLRINFIPTSFRFLEGANEVMQIKKPQF